MSDYTDEDLKAMQDYANGATPGGSQLIDLPSGGSVVQDNDGYAGLVQRPQAYANTRNDTDYANDLRDYLQYARDTGARIGPAQNSLPDETQGGHAMLNFAIPESVTGPITNAGQAVHNFGQQAQQAGQQAVQGFRGFVANPKSIGPAITKTNDQLIREGRKVLPPTSGLGIIAKDVETSDEKAKRQAEEAKATGETVGGATPDGGQANNQGPAFFRPAPQQVIPGGWMSRISPESQGLEKEAFGPQREDELRNQEIDQRLYNQKVVDAKAQAEGEAQAELDRAQAERQRQAALVQKAQDQAGAANAAYNAAKIDPNRFFANQSTGDRVMSAIGVALGAFGSSLTHSPNFALDTINHAVDQDIEAQKAEMAKKGQNANNMMSMLTKQLGSQQDAESVYKEAALRHAQAQASTLAAQGNDAQLQQQLDAQLQTLRETRANRNEAHEAYRPPQVIGGGGGLSEKDMGLVLNLPGNGDVKAPNQAAYDGLTKASEAYNKVNADLGDYAAKVKNLTAYDKFLYKTGIQTKAMSAALAAHSNALGEMRKANDDGTWKKAEAEGGLFDKMLLSPDAITGDVDAQIGAARKHLDNSLNATIGTYRALPVQTGYTRNAKGQIEPTAAYTGGPAAKQGQKNVPSSFKAE